jgi:hypothetical protein
MRDKKSKRVFGRCLAIFVFFLYGANAFAGLTLNQTSFIRTDNAVIATFIPDTPLEQTQWVKFEWNVPNRASNRPFAVMEGAVNTYATFSSSHNINGTPLGIYLGEWSVSVFVSEPGTLSTPGVYSSRPAETLYFRVDSEAGVYSYHVTDTKFFAKQDNNGNPLDERPSATFTTEDDMIKIGSYYDYFYNPIYQKIYLYYKTYTQQFPAKIAQRIDIKRI